ncbi:MAG: hypothetical protein RLY23_23, partial [Actinomycetota bacterium]
MLRKKSFTVGVLLILTGGLSLAACGSTEETPNSSPVPSVDVLVSEWIVRPKPNEVKAGQLKIFVDNA